MNPTGQRDGFVTLIIGKRGSGKTTYIKREIASLSRVLVFDLKHEYNLQSLPFPAPFATFRTILNRQRFCVRWPIQKSPAKELGIFADFLLREGVRNVTVILDEAYFYLEREYIEGAVGRLLRLGRAQGLNVLMATQRISRIPGVFISEADRLIAFHVHHHADLRILSHYIDPSVVEQVRNLRTFQYVDIPLVS